MQKCHVCYCCIVNLLNGIKFKQSLLDSACLRGRGAKNKKNKGHERHVVVFKNSLMM